MPRPLSGSAAADKTAIPVPVAPGLEGEVELGKDKDTRQQPAEHLEDAHALGANAVHHVASLWAQVSKVVKAKRNGPQHRRQVRVGNKNVHKAPHFALWGAQHRRMEGGREETETEKAEERY